MKLALALFLGVVLVAFRGLTALGMVLLVFGQQQVDEKRPHHEDHVSARCPETAGGTEPRPNGAR